MKTLRIILAALFTTFVITSCGSESLTQAPAPSPVATTSSPSPTASPSPTPAPTRVPEPIETVVPYTPPATHEPIDDVASSNTNDEQEYLKDVARFMSPAMNDEPQDQVLLLGKTVCLKLAQGFSTDDIIDVLQGNFSQNDATVIVAAATVNLCSEYGNR